MAGGLSQAVGVDALTNASMFNNYLIFIWREKYSEANKFDEFGTNQMILFCKARTAADCSAQYTFNVFLSPSTS